ncbi:MAG: hypothetical protein Q8P20_10615 [bacterium]|nr:hypothetical protein [bacterium]
MKKNKIILVLAIIVILVLVLVVSLISRKNSNSPGELSDSSYGNFKQILGDEVLAQKMRVTDISIDSDKKDVVRVQKGIMMSDAVYTHNAQLSDVSGGRATGLAKAGYSDGTYNLSASFAGLIEPQNGDFYEGWIVRVDPFDFISTGKLEKLGGIYSNLHKSDNNLMDHDFYVLTIEPDDGNSAPGVHILEGNLIKK